MPPRVTVVTGYYNRKNLLKRTIDSILSQTFRDLELIVFDDASTDGSALRLRELEEEYADPRLRTVIHPTNRGFVRGLKESIQLSSPSSEFIAIQGSGDISAPRRIEQQVALLDERGEVGVVGCWFETVNETTQSRSTRRLVADDVGFNELLLGNVFSHGEVMFRREVYDRVGGYRTEFKFTQDYDLWLRLIQICSFATVKEVLYERFLLNDGVALTPSKLIDQRRFQILARRLRAMPESEELRTLGVVREHGVAAAIGLDDPEFRRTHLRATVDMGLNRSAPVAAEMARLGVDGRFRRTALAAFFDVYETPLLWPARQAVSAGRSARRALRKSKPNPGGR
jgi:hypothetical protein